MDPKAYVYLAMSGEQVRGQPGCVLVDQNEHTAKYMLLGEFDGPMRTHAEKLLEDDNETHYFVLVKSGGSIHVLKHRRDQARDDFRAQLGRMVADAGDSRGVPEGSQAISEAP